MPYLLSHINVLQQLHLIPINIIISSQVVRSKKVDAHLRSNLIGLQSLFFSEQLVVITVCSLIEKFECAGKFTMCGNNVTRKYWFIADRPNEAKKCGPFSPLVQILWGGGGGGGASIVIGPLDLKQFLPKVKYFC